MADLLALSFGHWDLSDILFLVLGVFMILINKIILVNPIGYLVILRDLDRGVMNRVDIWRINLGGKAGIRLVVVLTGIKQASTRHRCVSWYRPAGCRYGRPDSIYRE